MAFTAYLDLVCDVRSHQPQRNITFGVNIRCSATHIDRTNQSNLWEFWMTAKMSQSIFREPEFLVQSFICHNKRYKSLGQIPFYPYECESDSHTEHQQKLDPVKCSSGLSRWARRPFHFQHELRNIANQTPFPEHLHSCLSREWHHWTPKGRHQSSSKWRIWDARQFHVGTPASCWLAKKNNLFIC